jgi:hypothetical protein
MLAVAIRLRVNRIPDERAAAAGIVLNDATLGQAQFFRRMPKSCNEGLSLTIAFGKAHEHANPAHVAGLLCSPRKMPGYRCTAEKRYGCPLPHGFAARAEDQMTEYDNCSRSPRHTHDGNICRSGPLWLNHHQRLPALTLPDVRCALSSDQTISAPRLVAMGQEATHAPQYFRRRHKQKDRLAAVSPKSDDVISVRRL